MESGEHMVTLSQQMKELADGFRKRFGKTGDLTLADMTKLVTTPAFPSGINLIKKPIYFDFNGYGPESKSATFDVVPPQMSKPITLTFTLQNDAYLQARYGSLILTKTGGAMLELPIPEWTSDYAENKKWTHDYVVTIPANTSLASGKFTISFPNVFHSGFTITQIIATYVGGGN